MSPALSSSVAASKFLDGEVLQIDVDGAGSSSPGAYFPTLPGKGNPLRGNSKVPLPLPTAGEQRELKGLLGRGTAPVPGHCARILASPLLSLSFFLGGHYLGQPFPPNRAGGSGEKGTSRGPLREAWQSAGAIFRRVLL